MRPEENDLMCEEYIKYEILEEDFYAQDANKQAVYCGNKMLEIFNTLEKTLKSKDAAMQALNNYSEIHYNIIKKKTLKLEWSN